VAPLAAVTVAVNVTESPYVDALALEDTVVVVGTLMTNVPVIEALSPPLP
jgi:hypothetical protein